jgi:hypothetical protein
LGIAVSLLRPPGHLPAAFSCAKLETRHDAQVKAALASGPCAFIILGGGHDLSASVRLLKAVAPQLELDLSVLQALDARRQIQAEREKKALERERGIKDKELELRQRPDELDGVRRAEEALRALRDAKDEPSRRVALEALDRALRRLRQQLPGAPYDEKKKS